MKIVKTIQLKIVIFTAVKERCMLHMHVFVMSQVKEKLLDLIEQTFYKKEGKLYLTCNDKNAFFTSADHYSPLVLSECM